MDPRLKRLAPLVLRAYAWAFVILGAAGVLGAHLGLVPLYGLHLLPEQSEAATSLLNQLRFLRAVEIGYGLVLLSLVDPFFAPGAVRSPVNRAVLAGLAALPAARTLSLIVDGPPRAWLGTLLIVEWALFLWLRRATEPTGTDGTDGTQGSADFEVL